MTKFDHEPDSGEIHAEKPVAALLSLAAAIVVIGGLHAAAPLLTQMLIIGFDLAHIGEDRSSSP